MATRVLSGGIGDLIARSKANNDNLTSQLLAAVMRKKIAEQQEKAKNERELTTTNVLLDMAEKDKTITPELAAGIRQKLTTGGTVLASPIRSYLSTLMANTSKGEALEVTKDRINKWYDYLIESVGLNKAKLSLAEKIANRNAAIKIVAMENQTARPSGINIPGFDVGTTNEPEFNPLQEVLDIIPKLQNNTTDQYQGGNVTNAEPARPSDLPDDAIWDPNQKIWIGSDGTQYSP
jgi:hypothetical protein